MARPPWGERDRLEAPDLNAAFATVAQGRMPGALCPAGSNVSLAANVSTELAIPQPVAGDDLGGYWQSNGRFVVPKGLTGLHALTVGLAGLAGAPKGDTLRLAIAGMGYAGPVFPFSATGGAAESGRLFTFAAYVPELTTVYLTVAADSATSARLTVVRIARLASFGVYV